MSLRACMVGAVVVLVACHSTPTTLPLPQGEQTLSGFLVQAPLSLVRRGSHVLLHDGQERYYVESSTVNLRSYERKNLTLRGVLEANSDLSALPVLVVDSIVDVDDAFEQTDFPFLHMSMTVPRSWKSEKEGNTVRFFLSNEESPFLFLSEQEGQELPAGTSVVVDGRPAVRIVNEATGNQTLLIQREHTILSLSFSPGIESDSQQLRVEWLELLNSLSLHAEQATSSRAGGTGTGSSTLPCGGTAGILCPTGMYCRIADFQENVGMCVKMATGQ